MHTFKIHVSYIHLNIIGNTAELKWFSILEPYLEFLEPYLELTFPLLEYV